MNVELLDKAIAGALCPTFNALATASNQVMVYSAAASLIPGAQAPALAVLKTSALVSGLSMLGASATCPETEIGPPPTPGPNDLPQRGCVELSSGQGALYIVTTQGMTLVYRPLTGYKITFLNNRPDLGAREYWLDIQKVNGGPYTREPIPVTVPDGGYLMMDLDSAAICGSDAPIIPEYPTVPDHIYIDQSTNCGYIVKFQGIIQETEGGPLQPVYEISGQANEQRSGGRMGGCYMNPVIYTPGPTGPGGPGGPRLPPIPVPPNPPGPNGDGVPWWASALLGAAAGAAINQILDALAELTAPRFQPGSFTMTAPCDVDEAGEPEYRTWQFAEGTFAERMNDHQVALMEMLQQHLNWKTPVCPPEPPVLKGDWRTISFISDEPSPYGKSRLRKRFRYRSSSGIGLDELIDHWADFTWQAGPVCVKHSGAPWGYPQVWAASIDEGKRVIQHAATEAGFDANKVGRWEVGGSSDGRYGVPGTMRVRTDGGYFWITARDGSDMRPLVGKI